MVTQSLKRMICSRLQVEPKRGKMAEREIERLPSWQCSGPVIKCIKYDAKGLTPFILYLVIATCECLKNLF